MPDALHGCNLYPHSCINPQFPLFPQIRRIVEGEDMPPAGHRQTMLFSATFPKEIQRLAADFLHDYIFLTVGRVGSSTDLIAQHIEYMQSDQKKETVLDCVNTVEVRSQRVYRAWVGLGVKRACWQASGWGGSRCSCWKFEKAAGQWLCHSAVGGLCCRGQSEQSRAQQGRQQHCRRSASAHKAAGKQQYGFAG